MDKPELVRLLKARFTPQEMRSLVRDLGESPDDIRMNPETVGEFAWEIVEYFARLNKLQEIAAGIERSHKLPAARVRQGWSAALPVSLGLGGALALVLLFVLLGRAPRLPVELQAPQRLTALMPLPEGSGGVLVALQSSSSDAVAAHVDLCRRLNERDGGSLVRCLDAPFLANNDDELRSVAELLGASLAVGVGPGRAAHIIPLKELERDALLADAASRVDLSPKGAAEALSPVLLALSAIASPSFNKNKAACLDMPSGASGLLGVLTVYTRQFSSECVTNRSELGALQNAARCGSEQRDEKRRCALAKYLLAERCPDCDEAPGDLAYLKRELNKETDGPYRSLVELKLAQSYCKDADVARSSAGDLIASLTDLLRVARDNDCFRATLTWIADCALRAAAPGGGIDVASEGQELKQELEDLSKWTPKAYEECSDLGVRSTALEWRAYGYALASDWRNAAEFYKAAADAYNTSDRRLGSAEARLHMKEPRDAYNALQNDTFGVMCASPASAEGVVADPVALMRARSSIRYAILGWIAARQTKGSREGEYGRCLVKKNAELPEGEPAIRSEDAGLKKLLHEVTGDDRLYENLRGENSSATRKDLQKRVGVQ